MWKSTVWLKLEFVLWNIYLTALPLSVSMCSMILAALFLQTVKLLAREAARTSLSNSVDMMQSFYLHIVCKQSFLAWYPSACTCRGSWKTPSFKDFFFCWLCCCAQFWQVMSMFLCVCVFVFVSLQMFFVSTTTVSVAAEQEVLSACCSLWFLFFFL